MSCFLNNSFIRESALLVFEKITNPEVGRSNRCITPQKTLPSFLYFSASQRLIFSGNGSSPVLSPWVLSPEALFTAIIWFSSYIRSIAIFSIVLLYLGHL